MKRQIMTIMKRKIFFFLLLITFFPAFSLTTIPELEKPIMDLAGIVGNETEEILDSYLRDIYEKTGIQIAVLTVSEIGRESVENFTMRVCESWKLGTKENDSGVLLTVSYHDHKLRIDVGYGLEHLLTDVETYRIINDTIVPEFHDDRYSEGIKKGVLRIAEKALNGIEINTDAANKVRKEKGDLVGKIFFLIWGLLFLFIIGQGSGLLPMFICMLTGRPYVRRVHRDMGGGYDSDGSGGFTGFGSDSGGDSSGGYSGGGGSFGGGGSTGSW